MLKPVPRTRPQVAEDVVDHLKDVANKLERIALRLEMITEQQEAKVRDERRAQEGDEADSSAG